MLLACLLLGSSFVAARSQTQPANPADANVAAKSVPASVAARRARLLHRGVNASMWFAQARDYSPGRLRSYTTADDIAQ